MRIKLAWIWILALVVAACGQTVSGGGSASGAGAGPTPQGLSQLVFTSANPPNGQTTVSYSFQFLAGGGTLPIAWSQTAGTLPTGLTLNASSGVLSGTPTTTGAFNFVVTVHDSGNPVQTISQSFQVVITASAPLPPTITTTSVPNGTENQAYTTTFNATNGTSPYSWSNPTPGTLPPGLTLNASTGVLSGTPTTPGSYTFPIQCTDFLLVTCTNGPKNFTIVIAAAPPQLVITSANPPNGQTTIVYGPFPLTTTGGTGAVTFGLASGSSPLPTGLSIVGSNLQGTPSAIGTFTPTMQACDSGSPQQCVTQPWTIVITSGVAPPQITTTSIPGATQGIPYSVTFASIGGTPPITWSQPSGTLPTGLTLHASTGVLDGTPTTAGGFNFTIQCTDSLSVACTNGPMAFSINVASSAQPLVITSLNPPNGQTTISYGPFQVTTSGGTAPITFALNAGSNPLPTGLSLSSGGLLSGTPSAIGTFTPTIKATDSGLPPQATTQPWTIIISNGAGAPTITSGVPPNGTINIPYSFQFTATCPAGGCTWSAQ